MRRTRPRQRIGDLAGRPLLAVLVAVGLLLAGCASDGTPDDATEGDPTEQATDGGADDGDMDEADDATDDAEDEDEDAGDDGQDATADDGAAAEGTGTATIEFAGGETLTTDVLCVLEPQDDPGSDGQILYTATATSNPYFDVTVFADANGNETQAFVSWDDTEDFETFQASWSAGGLGSDLEVSLDGTTITGSGTFIRGTDESGEEGETRQGEVTVECG